MERHLGPVPDPAADGEDPFEDEDPFADGSFDQPMAPRAPWWRWVAILVAVALVVATPFAYALSRLLD